MNATETFVVEYGCSRFCRIELDLDDRYHKQTTRNQLRKYADAEHDRIHPRDSGSRHDAD